MNKKILTLLALLLINFSIFGQESLTKQNSSWSLVISGKVMSEPAITSFGFSLISDARTISTFSNTGKLLWEKDFKNYRDSRIYALPEDFFLVVKNSYRTISLLNPSGYKIWTKDFDYPIYGAPFAGRDGRFFVRTIDSIYCLGITGIEKWKLDLPKQNNIQLQELPDGSFVTFLEQVEEGKSKGLRISPFGEVMEEITFAGKVLTAATCTTGILLTFDDGSAGLFALNKELNAENKWVLQTSQLRPDKQQSECAQFIVDDSKEKVIYVFPYKNKLQLFNIRVSDGVVLNSFFVEDIKGFDIKNITYQDKDIFITDYSKGTFYTDAGVEIWSGKLPVSANQPIFNFAFFTKDNSLILCCKDWSLDAYKLKQNVNYFTADEEINNYKAFYDKPTNAYLYLTQLNSELANPKRIQDLKNGNYGSKELTYINQLNEACQSYSEFISSKATNYSDQKSFFETDIADLELMMCQLSLFSGSTFNSYISKYLKTLSNRTLQFALLAGISENGYDPELKIIKALGIMAGKINYKDDVMLCKICDSVYSICVFMGRPAYNAMGKEIIKKMLSANYSSKTRTYARTTLKKIMDLEL